MRPDPAYDPQACPPPVGAAALSQRCLDSCSALSRAGCDCFGCCTVCDPATNECFDIVTNPFIAPNCDETTLDDPSACFACTKVLSCGGGACGGTTCVACMGQDPDDLPASCAP